MNLELTVIELGEALRRLDENYDLEIVIKMNLSGGWMTVMGNATIEKIPSEPVGCNGKSMNIIDIRVNCDESDGSLVKLTGGTGKLFNVSLEAAKFKEISKGLISINRVQTNYDETKFRIDDNIIIKIKDNLENVCKTIKA